MKLTIDDFLTQLLERAITKSPLSLETLRTEKHQTARIWITSKQLGLLNGLSKGRATEGTINKLGEDSIWEVNRPASNGACIIKFNLNFFNKNKENFNKSQTEIERHARYKIEFDEEIRLWEEKQKQTT